MLKEKEPSLLSGAGYLDIQTGEYWNAETVSTQRHITPLFQHSSIPLFRTAIYNKPSVESPFI
jgi:hypothetical protein